MECEWTVDEADGCTLRVQCSMKDACATDECYDLDTLMEKALHAPRYFTDSKLITGPSANLSDVCTTNCGKICASVEPTNWSDYLPTVDISPMVNDYIYPVYTSIAHVLYFYLFTPIYDWIYTPLFNYALIPLYMFVLGPIWNLVVSMLYAVYEYLPSPDLYTMEFVIHLVAGVFTTAAIAIVILVYFCYVFTDSAKFGVVTRHPLKEKMSENGDDSGQQEEHGQRRFSYPASTLKERKSSLLNALQRKLRFIAREEDAKDGHMRKRSYTEGDEKANINPRSNGT